MSSDPSDLEGLPKDSTLVSPCPGFTSGPPSHRHPVHGFGPRHDARGYPMRDERFEVTVTFDERRGYVGSAPEMRSPVTALSLGGLCRRIEALLMPDTVEVKLVLDRAARLERDQRRRGGASRAGG